MIDEIWIKTRAANIARAAYIGKMGVALAQNPCCAGLLAIIDVPGSYVAKSSVADSCRIAQIAAG